MRSIRLASRRSGAQAGLLATVGAVSLVLTAIVVGLIGYLEYSATVNTRAFVEHAAPTANSIRIETKLATDGGAQDASVRHLLDSAFADIPRTVSRSLTDFPLPATLDGDPLTLANGTDARITAAADAQAEKYVTLVDGAWPVSSSATGSAQQPFPGALQADAAQELGLSVGDTVLVGKGSEAKFITISATWLPNDATDPHWFSDSGVATGNAVAAGDGTASFGPLLVEESALATLGPVPTVLWIITLDADQITPAQLDRAGTVAINLREDLLAEGTLGNDIQVDGSLADTAKSVHASLESVRGVTPVGLLLMALIGVIALVQLARLLSAARRPENALLRSRGASAQWLTQYRAVRTVGVCGTRSARGSAHFRGDRVPRFRSHRQARRGR